MKYPILLAGVALVTLSGAGIAADPTTAGAAIDSSVAAPAPDAAAAAPDAAAPAADAATTAATPDTSASGTTAADATTAAPAADASAATTTDTATPATAPSDTASTANMPAEAPTAAPTDTASAAATAAPVDPAKAQAADQMIAQNWTKYDPQNKGQLTPLEFGEWVMAAQGNDMSAKAEKSRQSKASGLASTKVLNATATEFSRADTNKDRAVSQDELKAYLAG